MLVRRRIKRGSDKRGAAHFEMIISFVFFITFIFFLFVVLKPYNTSTLSGAVILGMYDSFSEEVTTNLTNVFLKANYSDENSNPLPPGGCFYVELQNEIFAYALTESVVTDVNDLDVNSSIGDGAPTSNLNIDNDTEVFYKVAISPDFVDDGTTGCELVSNYVLGSLLEREVISYKALGAMTERYNDPAQYEALKAELRVPSVFDFAIITSDLSNVSMERLIPDSGDVVANDYILEVLHPNGTIINARFTLMVW